VPTDASFSVSVMRVGGRRESILVWDEEEDDFNVDEEDERVPRERWDERLVLGSGWLYKQDLKIEQLGKQQDAVAQYLDTVDEVLFYGTKGGVRGWASEMERADSREKLEREARGKVRKSSVPFPEMDSPRPSRPRKLLGATLPDGWHPRICWTPCRISLSRRSPRRFRRSQKNTIMTTTPIDLAWTTTTFHGGHSAVHSRTVNSHARTPSSSRSFPHPFCPTYPHHQIGPTC